MLKWIARKLGFVKLELAPAAVTIVDNEETLPHVRQAPRIVCILGAPEEVEAAVWLVMGVAAENYKIAVTSSDRVISEIVKTHFDLPLTSAVDMFLGVSGDLLGSSIRGSIDANYPEIWERNLEKVRDRLEPDIFVVTPTLESEIRWCWNAGAVTLATPSYAGIEVPTLRLTSLDEDQIIAALERMAEMASEKVVARPPPTPTKVAP